MRDDKHQQHRGGRRDGQRSTREEGGENARDRSWRLRCSLLLKALLQNWHLYLRSAGSWAFREVGVDDADGGRTATLAPGILRDDASEHDAIAGRKGVSRLPTRACLPSVGAAVGTVCLSAARCFA